MFDITDKVAVVTGATGVLCGAMARCLADHGARVVLVGRNQEKGKRIEQEIRTKGGEAIFVPADVLNPKQVTSVRDQALNTYGRIDILVNGAGGNRKEATTSPELSFFDMPLEALKGVIDLNLLGTLLPTQVLGEVMAKQKSGVIVNISSMAATRPMTRVLGYAAAKASIDNVTKWLAVYLNQNVSKDIRVNAIAPGFFLTEQNHQLVMDDLTGCPTARGELILAHTPMARFGTPEDLLGTLLWLVSDASKFVNGVVVPVDGGFSAYAGV